MNDKTYQLLSNVGDDLKALAGRADKRIIVRKSGKNAARMKAFDVLAESGVVKIETPDEGVFTVTLLL